MVGALLGLDHGLAVLDDGSGEVRPLPVPDGDKPIAHVVRESTTWYAVAGDGGILRGSGDGGWEQIAMVESGDLVARCLAPHHSGLLIGTSEAHLLRLRQGRLERIERFDEVDGRDEWYTPWGGPPDVRSMSVGDDGTIYVNVHVGGVVRSIDHGETWQPTMDIDMDVHQVLIHPDGRGRVFAASARGLGISEDRGASWTFLTDRTPRHVLPRRRGGGRPRPSLGVLRPTRKRGGGLPAAARRVGPVREVHGRVAGMVRPQHRHVLPCRPQGHRGVRYLGRSSVRLGGPGPVVAPGRRRSGRRDPLRCAFVTSPDGSSTTPDTDPCTVLTGPIGAGENRVQAARLTSHRM